MRLDLGGETADPHQFLGLEINPRAATIAELVLWIGYLQWHHRNRGATEWPEPVLRAFKNSVTESYGTPEIRVELSLSSPAAKDQFAALELQKDRFAQALDLPLHWHNPPKRNQCRVYVRTEMDFTDRKTWPECFTWLQRYLERFAEIFGPVVKSL